MMIQRVLSQMRDIHIFRLSLRAVIRKKQKRKTQHRIRLIK